MFLYYKHSNWQHKNHYQPRQCIKYNNNWPIGHAYNSTTMCVLSLPLWHTLYTVRTCCIWVTTDNEQKTIWSYPQSRYVPLGTCLYWKDTCTYWNWNSQEDEDESNWSSIIARASIIAASRSHGKKLLCKQLWIKLHKSSTIWNKLAHILRYARVFWYIGNSVAAVVTSFENYLCWS